jgi:Raf kinase inhibitor-like YbhB/YbcL family protein
MEIAGGIFLGVILMFSMLAFSPDENTPILQWVKKEWAAIQTARADSSAAIIEAKIVETKRTTFSVTSASFKNSGFIPSKFTCDSKGAEVSPALSISNVPKETQSLVVIMDDPDAQGGIWTHWVVFNIPPTVREISEGKEPPGRAGLNSWGKTGYGGPCPPATLREAMRAGPPKGTHRYFFRVYALNKTLPLNAGSTKEEVLTAMKGSVLATTELMGRYQRQSK